MRKGCRRDRLIKTDSAKEARLVQFRDQAKGGAADGGNRKERSWETVTPSIAASHAQYDGHRGGRWTERASDDRRHLYDSTPHADPKANARLYQRSQRLTDVSPVARSDGCDGFGLGDEFAPGGAGTVDDGVVVFEDGV